jgi:hypothetical protein
MTILSHIGAIAALLGLFVFYRWRTRVPKDPSSETQDKVVQDFLHISWDTLESINDATSPAELEACQQKIDFIAGTFKGLIESGYLEQHVTRLDLALAMTRSRIQKKSDLGKPFPR